MTQQAVNDGFEAVRPVFDKDVSGHGLSIEVTGGGSTVLSARNPASPFRGFQVVIESGWLTVRGDMGVYVFRGIWDPVDALDGREFITASYMASKLAAADTETGFKEYSPELFTKHVLEQLDRAQVADTVRAAAASRVLAWADNADEAVVAASSFCCEGFAFEDAGQWDCHAFTHHFLWCCLAARWAITGYAQMSTGQAGAEAA